MTAEAQSEQSGRRKLVSRAVYGSFLGLATAFILSSTAQLIIGVFGAGVGSLPAEGATQTGSACAQGIARLATALDKSLARAALPDLDEGHVHKGGGAAAEGAVESFRKDLGPEWARGASEVEA